MYLTGNRTETFEQTLTQLNSFIFNQFYFTFLYHFFSHDHVNVLSL